MLTTERSDKVLDLFAGIGTVGKVAIENGRDFVGYDIDKGILRIASILLDGCNKTPEPKYGTLTEVPDLMAWVQEV
jgi:DNA modification methylase